MNISGNRKVVLIVASLSSFLTPFMGSSVSVALPAIGEAFSLDALTLGWVSTSYLIASSVFLLPLGRAADIYGRKRIFIWGLTVFTLSSVLVALSPFISMLITFRILQGVGSSMVFGTGTAILIEAYPLEERGRVLGINLAATYLGLSLGPFLGGVLTGSFGWESVFLVNVPLSVTALILALKGIEEGHRDEGPGTFDVAGSLIYSVSLVGVMYGFSKIPGEVGFALTLAGMMGLVFFIVWEGKVEGPVLDMGLMTRNRQFAFSNLAAFIHYSATFAITFLMSLYLQYVRGMSPEGAGLVLVSQPVVMMLLSPVAGRLSDKIEPRFIASLGMAVTCLGIFFLVFLHESTSLVNILLPLAILGLGFALFSSPNTNAIMSSVEKSSYGLASGMVATMRLTGQTASMGIVLALFAVFIGQNRIVPQIFPDFMKSMRAGFIIFCLLCAAGAAASMARGKIHEANDDSFRG